MAEQLGAAGLARSLAPGKWTARQIFCHLGDCEIAFGFRIRQALAEPDHVIQPFNQDEWARAYNSDSLSAAAAIEVFSVLRKWNLLLVNSLPQQVFSKPVTHPERGRMSFRTLIETMAGHDLNHLAQLHTLAQNQR